MIEYLIAAFLKEKNICDTSTSAADKYWTTFIFSLFLQRKCNNLVSLLDEKRVCFVGQEAFPPPPPPPLVLPLPLFPNHLMGLVALTGLSLSSLSFSLASFFHFFLSPPNPAKGGGRVSASRDLARQRNRRRSEMTLRQRLE